MVRPIEAGAENKQKAGTTTILKVLDLSTKTGGEIKSPKGRTWLKKRSGVRYEGRKAWKSPTWGSGRKGKDKAYTHGKKGIDRWE